MVQGLSASIRHTLKTIRLFEETKFEIFVIACIIWFASLENVTDSDCMPNNVFNFSDK